MPITTWPHAHLAHAVALYLMNVTSAGPRVTTRVPRNRTYPLLVVQPAGLGPLGTDSAIQADEPRLQIDGWAETQEAAYALGAEAFRLLDARFNGAPRFVTWMTEDEAVPGRWYETKIERIRRAGGGELYFDEIARVFRSTVFYFAKINL